MTNFEAFLIEVAGHWLFWIGLLLMVEPYLEGVAPRKAALLEGLFAKWPTLRQRIFRIVGAMALFVACFQTWNVQYEAAAGLQNRLGLKSLLAMSIKEGEDLDRDWFKRTDDVQFRHDTNVWTNNTAHLVEDAFGKGELSVFMSDAGYVNYSDGRVHTELHNWIINRLHRLNDLVEKVDTISISPGFNAKNYHWTTKCSRC